MDERNYAENKKAFFDYEILEKFEAGLVLLGGEVKSIRDGQMSIKASYVVITQKGEPELIGARIPPYQPNNTQADYRSDRSRKLLLNKKEIDYLVGKSHQKGLTFVPLRVYNNKGRIKLEFGIGKGKKEFDKRASVKNRDTKREIQRFIKNNL
jgi:SsrA-binding protein